MASTAISFDQPGVEGGDYLLHGRVDGRAVRCIATHKTLVDCLGAAISAPEVDLVQAAETCRPALEFAFRNKILTEGLDAAAGGAGEREVVLTHDSFFHWANESGADPPD